MISRVLHFARRFFAALDALVKDWKAWVPQSGPHRRRFSVIFPVLCLAVACGSREAWILLGDDFQTIFLIQPVFGLIVDTCTCVSPGGLRPYPSIIYVKVEIGFGGRSSEIGTFFRAQCIWQLILTSLGDDFKEILSCSALLA